MEQYAYNAQLSAETLIVFLMATYGDGEPTDNAVDFYEWLTEQTGAPDEGAATSLEQLSFAVFGLGNRQYEHFNSAGKQLHKALRDLGGSPLVPVGLGDDDDDIDDDFQQWGQALLSALDASPLVTAAEEQHTSAAAEFAVEMLPSDSMCAPPHPSSSGRDAHHPYKATVISRRELHTARSPRSCVHVELDISGAGARYETGDHVALYPENSPEIVTSAAARLSVPLDSVFRLSVPPGVPDGQLEAFPSPTTLRTALTQFTDLAGLPPKTSLAAMAQCAGDPCEAARLVHLSSHDGKADYADWITKHQRSLLEVLDAFPSVRPGLGLFFGSIAPRLQPRFYSISSSSLSFPDAVHITCAVVRDQLPGGRVHHGVCSSWLARLHPGDTVPLFLRASSFKLPPRPEVPIVMIGPGTGLAPFRGFLQDRSAAGAAGGAAHLFFGCRHPEEDYLYREELEAAEAAGTVSGLHLAFSRLGQQKHYVQHELARVGAMVWRLLGPEGLGQLYVCGDAKYMAKDVHRALVGCIQEVEACSATEAEAAVKLLQDSGRYHRDVW